MPWTAPRTWTIGENVTKAILDTHIRDNELFLRAFHGGRMWQSAALSHTANGANQLITWDTTDYDVDSFNVLASEWFIVPTGFAGYYRISAHARWAGNATGVRRLRLMKNETYATRTPNAVGTLLSNDSAPAPSANDVGQSIDWTGPLVVGDHVTLEGFQSSGGNLAYGVGKEELWFVAQYLGS
jgi:hypothetical protein